MSTILKLSETKTKIFNNIIIDESSKESNGSLFRLFSSQYFSINYLIGYLFRRNEITIIDTLISILHKKYKNEAYFYLPQIW